MLEGIHNFSWQLETLVCFEGSTDFHAVIPNGAEFAGVRRGERDVPIRFDESNRDGEAPQVAFHGDTALTLAM